MSKHLIFKHEADSITITDTKDGWRMHWVPKDAFGISPYLARREVAFLLNLFNAQALRNAEEHAKIFEMVKRMWNGTNFTLTMQSFASINPPPTIAIEPLTDGTEPPTTIHSIFVAAKEFCESKALFEKSCVSLRVVRGKLRGEPDKDGYYKIDLSAVQTPVALGHPLPPFSNQEFGIRANVEVQEDGTAKLLDGPVTFNPIQ